MGHCASVIETVVCNVLANGSNVRTVDLWQAGRPLTVGNALLGPSAAPKTGSLSRQTHSGPSGWITADLAERGQGRWFLRFSAPVRELARNQITFFQDEAQEQPHQGRNVMVVRDPFRGHAMRSFQLSGRN